MSAKHKKLQAPSWFEVGLGAALSVVLGVVLGVADLVMKPVVAAKEIPKDASSSTVYYIEGSRDFTKASAAAAERKAFADGESVTVEEGELNMLLTAAKSDSSPSKPAAKGAPAADVKAIDIGALNARIHGGKIQFADTVTYSVLGITGTVIVQAVGDFEKDGSEFEFVPDTFYVGGCPLQRLPFIRGFALKKLLFAQPIPEDIAAAWPKLVSVTIEESTMHLRMP
jgi:hypothetical protein